MLTIVLDQCACSFHPELEAEGRAQKRAQELSSGHLSFKAAKITERYRCTLRPLSRRCNLFSIYTYTCTHTHVYIRIYHSKIKVKWLGCTLVTRCREQERRTAKGQERSLKLSKQDDRNALNGPQAPSKTLSKDELCFPLSEGKQRVVKSSSLPSRPGAEGSPVDSMETSLKIQWLLPTTGPSAAERSPVSCGFPAPRSCR